MILRGVSVLIGQPEQFGWPISVEDEKELTLICS